MIIDELLERNITKINLLHAKVKEATEDLIYYCLRRGIHLLVKESLITHAQQESLYAIGRTRPGTIVTNLRGGESYHQYGLAIQVALLMPNGTIAPYSKLTDWDDDTYEDYKEVVIEAKKLGFEWGGEIEQVKDRWYFQMPLLPIEDLQAGMRPTPYTPTIPNSQPLNVTTMVKGVDVNQNGFSFNGKYYVPVYVVAKNVGAKAGTSIKGNAILDSVELLSTWAVRYTTYVKAEELAFAIGMKAIIDRNAPFVNFISV